MTPPAVLPLSIQRACVAVVFNEVIFGFRQSHKQSPSTRPAVLPALLRSIPLPTAQPHMATCPPTPGQHREVAAMAGSGSTRGCCVVQTQLAPTNSRSFSGSPSSQPLTLTCSRVGYNWRAGLLVFNSCASQSTISPSLLSLGLHRCTFKWIRTKVSRSHQVKHSTAFFIHKEEISEEISVNLPACNLKQLLWPGHRGIQGEAENLSSGPALERLVHSNK